MTLRIVTPTVKIILDYHSHL